MPSAKRSPAPAPTRKGPASPSRSSLVIKLQIAAAVFVPMLALGLWLRSQGFW